MTTTETVLHDIRRHGEETYPEECCGYLIGSIDAGTCHVSAALPAANTEDEERTSRYLLTPAAYQRAAAVARREKLDIVGFFHSHPDHPARPSETDLRDATFPGYRYVIVSVRRGTAGPITAWSLAPDRSRFMKEPITSSSPAPSTPAIQ